MYAFKAVKQYFYPSDNLKVLMHKFTDMVNFTINIMIEKNLTSRNSVSNEVYHKLKEYEIPSYYYIEAINKAVALVKTYRKRLKKKQKATVPHVEKPMLSTYYGFKIVGGNIMIPIANREYESIPLNAYVRDATSMVKVHSFALSAYTLSLTIGRDVDAIECTTTVGVDRNLRNITVGNEFHHEIYDLSNIVEIKQRYRKKESHFHRNDRRIREKILSKYGKRERNRVKQIMHETSKAIVSNASTKKEMIVLENIIGINQITKKGDGKGKDYRFLLKNAFPYGMLASQVMYKASWEGLPVIELTRKETRNTSRMCSVCGSLTRIEHGRILKCDSCGLEIDRDVNACINIAFRYRTCLKRSHKGLPGEAVKQSKDVEQMAGSQISMDI
ncbi:RNA-guided endonuclease InsQ/TnpB family protein [Thermoplasma volcanium]|uniref:RNA-guided endonuclease InsQ/TnpB family protein n=1 Tax=Thermoplasma volcanium TaxID=50339 RepID=UPI001F51FF15|nr:transposase [Thermoplasma volcanium]